MRGWSAFAHRFRIETPVPELDDHLAGLFDDLSSSDTPDHHYRISSEPDGRWVLRCDGEVVDEPSDPPRAVALLLWRINRGAIEDTSDRLLLHAGGVVLDGTGVVVAGDMEVGKTTLVTGLLRRGAGYLSDEAIGLGFEDELLHGYPKALSLDPGSWSLFPELEPDLPPAVASLLPHQWQVRASSLPGVEALHDAPAGLVVLPRYRPGASLSLRRLPGADALLRLSGCVFPTSLERRRILQRLAALVRSVPCYELEHGDLEESVDAIRELVASLPSPPPAPAVTTRGSAGVGSIDGSDTDTRPSSAATSPGGSGARPATRPEATVLDVGDAWVVHVAETDELHRLDQLAVRLWERLDGQRTERDLVDELTKDVDHGREAIEGAVRRFVAELDELGLLVWR